MSRDFERRVRSEIEELLDQFGVTYQHTHRSNHPAVQFEVNGRKMLFTYSHAGDYRTHLNARSDLRNLLISAGLKPQELPPSLEPIDQVVEEDHPPQQVEKEGVEVTEPTPTPEAPVEAPRQAVLNENGYTIYQVKGFQPNQMIAIELDRDLMCSKGHILLIPINRPNTVVDMTREQFDALFEPVELVAPTPVPEAPSPDPVEAPLVGEDAGIADEPIEEAEEDPFLPVNHVQEGVSGVKRPRGRPPRMQNWVDTPYRHTQPRSKAGLGPQAARVLITMAYQSKKSGKTDLTPDAVGDLLLLHDRRQYASRCKSLLALKLVERGLPLLEGSGHHYRVTPAGMRLAPRLGAWAWLYDGLDVPKWADQKL